MAAETFAVIASGVIKPHVFKTLRLAEASEAHRLLEGRSTTGSIVLTPDA